MVVLFVADYINHFVDGVVLETQFGCTDVLSHVHTGTVGTEQKLFVQSVLGQVSPNGAVFFFEEQIVFQSFQYNFFPSR